MLYVCPSSSSYPALTHPTLVVGVQQSASNVNVDAPTSSSIVKPHLLVLVTPFLQLSLPRALAATLLPSEAHDYPMSSCSHRLQVR